ncbi:MAG: AGE family epimerase/isomerase [Lachnospiraceae bacterium]|nr:AGE family epimerase/isomerase [Lachnospiraceae bacterium]
MLNKNEFKEHLENCLIPFWKALKDDEFGGYYGFVDYDLNLDKKAIKGCILNSRILWFFSNAYMVLNDETLKDYAKHAYEFMKKNCIDKTNGGIYWSMTYDGKPDDTMKHTYNQAFAIYALSSYYDISGDKEALDYAYSLYNIIETKCKDEIGYLEAADKEFNIISNEALSENGVMADRTMNTLLHVYEAYTELYRVTKNLDVKEKLIEIIDTFADKVYNKDLNRQEVFFNNKWESIIDLHSYGHDIETAWLMDKGVDIIDDPNVTAKMYPITKSLTKKIYEVAFDGNSLANECENGVVDERRIWWVQAETVLGFMNGYLKDNTKTEYMEAAEACWRFITKYVVDKREGSEWYKEVRKDGTPYEGLELVEPWKCPYHNGRMCIEVIKRM